MTSVQTGEVSVRIEEVAGYDGTFEDAVNAWMIREPRMMPFTEWAPWRRAEGLLPIPKNGDDRLMAYLEELKIWDRVMNYYHEEWSWFMDTWEVSETENVEAYLRSIKEDGKVFEQQAPQDTAEREKFTINTTVAAEPDGSAPVEDSYEHYEKRMNRLYAALDMPYIRVDEATYRTNFWDAEIASQISSLGKNDQVAWLKKLFKQIVMAPDDLIREDEKTLCADVIIGQLMKQGHNQERERADNEGTKETELIITQGWKLTRMERRAYSRMMVAAAPSGTAPQSTKGASNTALESCTKSKGEIKAEEKGGYSGHRSAVALAARNKKNRETQWRLVEGSLGQGAILGRSSTSGAPMRTEEKEVVYGEIESSYGLSRRMAKKAVAATVNNRKIREKREEKRKRREMNKVSVVALIDAPEPDLPAEADQKEIGRGKGYAQGPSQDDICFGLINEWRGEPAARKSAGTTCSFFP
jgi:hypothetical protein